MENTPNLPLDPFEGQKLPHYPGEPHNSLAPASLHDMGLPRASSLFRAMRLEHNHRHPQIDQSSVDELEI